MVDKKMIITQCYKHDGSLHRQWGDAYIILDDDNYFITITKRNKVNEANGRKWYTREPAISVYYKKDWFNVICMFKDIGIEYYCNIASPSILDKGYIKYIDYDLDLKLLADGTIKVLDENEFSSNLSHYEYSEDLVRILRKKVEKMKVMMKEKAFPFDEEKITALFNEYAHVLD